MHLFRKTIPATVDIPFFSCSIVKALQLVAATWAAVLIMLPASITLAADDAPQELVENAVNIVLQELHKHQDEIKDNPGILDATIDKNIVPHLDFVTMTRLSVGKNWKKANDEEQKALVGEFTTFLLNTYRSAMSEYGGEEVKFSPYKKSSRDDRAVVKSVFGTGSKAVPVQYKLRNKDSAWQVYDIVVSDLSLVVQYRSSFTSEIERNGVSGLIKLLKDKNNS